MRFRQRQFLCTRVAYNGIYTLQYNLKMVTTKPSANS